MLLIERTLILDLMNVPSDRAITDYSMKNYLEKLPVLPKTINEAVERLISELALKDKVIIANMTYGELLDLNSNLGAYIRNSFRLWYERSELMESCRFVSKDKQLSADGASLAILNALWERLRKTHKLKVVK